MSENIDILAKHNFWSAPPTDLGVIRSAHLEAIEGFMGNRLVKVLVGQRRAGKSYIEHGLVWKMLASD